MKSLSLVSIFVFFSLLAIAQPGTIKGKIVNSNGEPVAAAAVILDDNIRGTITNAGGDFLFDNVLPGHHKLKINSLGFKEEVKGIVVGAGKVEHDLTTLVSQDGILEKVEVFGQRNRQPEKLDAITRLPLKPSDQIQSISVISNRLIDKQGALSVIEGVRNVPGVYTYATYGGVRESISSRGFRGIPTLKNGVRVMSDFRGMGYPTDMEGVDNIQVLKGSSAITQGVGQASGSATDLGGPGGLVNVVTKTPRFINGGNASLRIGSFNLIRPTFDVQSLLNESGTVAFRINGAYQYGGKFRKGMEKESYYINPSIAFRPDKKTSITVEMDMYNVNETIDAGTVNLSVITNPTFNPAEPISSKNPQFITNVANEIFDLPTDQMLGFKSDISSVKHNTYSVSFRRYLDHSNNFYIRAAVYHSSFNSDAIRTTLKALPSVPGTNDQQVNLYTRTIGRNLPRLDKNTVIQFDFIGQDVYTGNIKHTFMAGTDYKITDLTEYTYNTIDIPGTINVFDPNSYSNTLPYGTPNFSKTGETNSRITNMGLTLQDVISLTANLKAFGALRFSTNQSNDFSAAGITRSHFVNPLAGLMYTIKPALNVFVSYTNSTKPENVTQIDSTGNTFGDSFVNQWEAGIKSDWLNNRLRFNLTAYRIEQKNIIEQLYDINNQAIKYNGRNVYRASGSDRRQGVEVELSGRILENLEAILGYSYIDAQFINTAVNVEGSAPNNTPKHTFNGWLNYEVNKGAVKGLNVGVGVYYLGARPYNDWTQAGYTTHGLDTSKEPWYNNAYTLVNAQIGYTINDRWKLQLFANNIMNATGYDAYRTSFIDRIQPLNFSGMITYKF